MVGAVPRGIALESDDTGNASQAWVLNVADNSVSRVDVSDPADPRVIDTITLEDPTHPAVKRGRITLRMDGQDKIRDRLSTPDEVLRVTQLDVE